jgi:hypothetical protein
MRHGSILSLVITFLFRKTLVFLGDSRCTQALIVSFYQHLSLSVI